MSTRSISYAQAILEAQEYLLDNHPDFFVIGQGLWAPWYVGTTMKDLDIKYGKSRIIDTPVSELGCTGAAIGASLNGTRPLVVHPRLDFMVLAIDQIVTQAANWSHMFGGQVSPRVTVRAIINRGGEQGAQHSQSLHAWFAHIPGLRVVMPATPKDARDLLIAGVLSDDPVLYIDDRWLYDEMEDVNSITPADLRVESPQIRKSGKDITIVAAGYSVKLALSAAQELEKTHGISAEVIDLRVINPLNLQPVFDSVKKTGRICAIDGGWKACGLAGEIVAAVSEELDAGSLLSRPLRITLPAAPAPTSKALEEVYYPDYKSVADKIGAHLSHSKTTLKASF